MRENEFKELILSEDFRDAFDNNNHEYFAEFLSDKAYNLSNDTLECIQKMVDSLGIFQDVAIKGFNPDKKYKYIVNGAIEEDLSDTMGPINLCGTKLFCGAVTAFDNGIIVDDKTIIDEYGLELISKFNGEYFNYSFTFLGIPTITKDSGIVIRASGSKYDYRGIDVYTKKELVEDLKKLFESPFIYCRNVRGPINFYSLDGDLIEKVGEDVIFD